MQAPEPGLCYQEGFVVFVDLLGFRERVRRAGSNAGPIREIWDMLQESKRVVETSTQSNMKGAVALQFSDTVVWCVPVGAHDSLRVLLNWVSSFEMTAFTRGLALRGGIARGDILIDGPVLFGPALIRAYDLEKLAIWPRVIVDPQIQEGDFSEVVRNNCIVCQDGFPALDYLGTIAAIAVWIQHRVEVRAAELLGNKVDSVDLSHVTGVDKFRLHGQLITRELSKHEFAADPLVWGKYRWLASYHNSAIQSVCGAAAGDDRLRELVLFQDRMVYAEAIGQLGA